MSRTENKASRTPMFTMDHPWKNECAFFERGVAAAARLDLDEASASLAWEIARMVQPGESLNAEAVFFLALVLLAALTRGHTFVPLEDPATDSIVSLLDTAEVASSVMDTVRTFIERFSVNHAALTSSVVGLRGDRKPILIANRAVAMNRMHYLEDYVVRTLRALCERTPTFNSADLATVDDLLRTDAALFALSDEQRIAVRSAVERPFTLISGGPGTGKTSIVVAIVRVLVRLGIPSTSIALAAPTGKAALRMEESIRAQLASIEAPSPLDLELVRSELKGQTLHRLLEFSPRTGLFRANERNPLAQQVVLMDEGSMVDLGAFVHLLRSLRPDGRLIIMGDADQLPSVEAGAVFRELAVSVGNLEESRAPWGGPVRLTRSFRMNPADPAGRNILGVAHAIRDGQVRDLFSSPGAKRSTVADQIRRCRRVPDLRFSQVELLEGGWGHVGGAFLDRWFTEKLSRHASLDLLARTVLRIEAGTLDDESRASFEPLFRHYERLRILCLTRTSMLRTGAESVNRLVHERMRAHLSEGDPRMLCPGEPIVMLRNDYARGLTNGDHGLVARARAGDHDSDLFAIFARGGDFLAFPLLSLDGEISLAYATTVHKSQGSEFDDVAVVLPDSDHPLLARDVLYTAVTRSRRSVVIIGECEMFVRGVERALYRHSGIAAGWIAGG